jgi:hypothetical protein
MAANGKELAVYVATDNAVLQHSILRDLASENIPAISAINSTTSSPCHVGPHPRASFNPYLGKDSSGHYITSTFSRAGCFKSTVIEWLQIVLSDGVMALPATGAAMESAFSRYAVIFSVHGSRPLLYTNKEKEWWKHLKCLNGTSRSISRVDYGNWLCEEH